MTLNVESRRPRGICELVLEASDVERLAGFYRELGLPLLGREGGRVWLATGPRSRLGIWPPGIQEHDDRGGRHVHFALSVEGRMLWDLAAAMRARGVPTEGPVEHDGGDRSVYLTDPEGNRVELWDFFDEGDGAEAGVAALAADAGGA
jgi:catechol-2,3-dioxygenase